MLSRVNITVDAPKTVPRNGMSTMARLSIGSRSLIVGAPCNNRAQSPNYPWRDY
jgi:hypothetical protein